jgi:putative acetyltransferase
VSLVAEDPGRIVGHVAFSPVQIAGAICHWFGLGPLSVHPDRQGRGVGSALVHEGLRRLRERSARGCVVLGYPAYYQRFGFHAEPRLTLAGSTPGHFMALCLAPPLPEGRVGYHPAFSPGDSSASH